MYISPILVEASSIEAAPIDSQLKVPAIDVVHVVATSGGIDLVRSLMMQAQTTAVSEVKRSFVIAVQTLTVEAQ
ncbi:MAG: hypothetical protein AAFO91_03020, partial [Bacteroidota bacterium]